MRTEMTPKIRRSDRSHSFPVSPMSTPGSPFCTIEEAVAELKAGRMVVMVDDEHRENEGDLVMAAQAVTPEAVNFMVMPPSHRGR